MTQNLPLHVQLHNSTQTAQLMSSELQCSWPFKLYTYQYIYIQSSCYIRPLKLTLVPQSTVSPVHSTTKHTQLLLSYKSYAFTDTHIQRLDSLNLCYWLQVWHDSDKEEVDVTKITDWHSVQTEGQLKYCQHHMLNWFKYYQFHRFLL